MAVAVYAGTFDPVTNGHVDIVQRAAPLFERLVVAVGARIEKCPLLEPAERVELLRETLAGIGNVGVEAFDGLVVDFARQQGATVLVRGIRNPNDYQYENTMALTNRRLAADLETVFFVADPNHQFISSTLIKEILEAGGDIAPFVPAHVAAAVGAKRG